MPQPAAAKDKKNGKIMKTSLYHTPGKYPGIFGWLFTTDHKRIGLLYLISTLSFFFVGVTLGLTMRLELIRSEPGHTEFRLSLPSPQPRFHGDPETGRP